MTATKSEEVDTKTEGDDKGDDPKLVEETKQYIKEHSEKLVTGNAMRERNKSATTSRPDEAFFRKLDSNMKKNTAFVKKLKTYTESQHDQLMKEFNGLNLSKYIAEIASALAEAKFKMSDVPSAVELCSMLHQRYADFSQCLLEEFKKLLPRKKTDTIANPSKLRVDLRLFADLIASGIFEESEALPMLGGCLGYLTATDKEEHANLATIISFCKLCGDDYAGLIPRKYRITAAKNGMPEIVCSGIFSADRQKNVYKLLKDYYETLSKRVIRLYRDVKKQERHIQKQLLMKGEMYPEAKQQLDEQQATFDKLYQNACALADFLDLDAPELPEIVEEMDKQQEEMMVMLAQFDSAGEGDGPGGGLFEDEDTRLFYEHLPELRAMLPGILYKDSEQAKLPQLQEELQELNAEDTGVAEELGGGVEGDTGSDDKQSKVSSDAPEAASEATRDSAIPIRDAHDSTATAGEELETDEVPPLDDDGIVEDQDVSGSTLKLLMDAFINELPKKVNRDLIDNAATDFVTNLNTPVNRKKLVKALYNVSRNRYDLLPFYARLIAVLNPVMPDLGTELVHMLIKEFRFRVRKKDQLHIESKLKVCRFLGELVKFKICPKSEVLHAFKMLLFDFRHHNVEMACTLMDTCGYYLYHCRESHPKTRVLLDQMMRRKQAGHLNQRYELMIENTECINSKIST